MDFGPKGHVNESLWKLSYALLLQRQDSLHQRPSSRLSRSCRAHRLPRNRFAGNKVQDMRKLSDGTLIIRGCCGFVIHPSVVLLSNRMRSHHFAWLMLFNCYFHQQLMIRDLVPFMRIWRKSSAKKTPSISSSWVTSMRKSGCQKKGNTGSGGLDQDSGMRMVTVLLCFCPPHDFFMVTPFS
ncbi:unnamed protein product [Strongylus vulgaris]|uniref:Uncharacterized protein n=1 Tax=Strongylus vulgaris TaxID=40348 RepID=A0A3P7JIF0_STRVU|nr:unnamed protein product [Strongylus vulgaris]